MYNFPNKIYPMITMFNAFRPGFTPSNVESSHESPLPLWFHQTWQAGKSPMNGGRFFLWEDHLSLNGPFSSQPCLMTLMTDIAIENGAL